MTQDNEKPEGIFLNILAKAVKPLTRNSKRRGVPKNYRVPNRKQINDVCTKNKIRCHNVWKSLSIT